jgi:serine/threonine protein kinase
MVPTKVSHYEITAKVGEEKGEDLYVAEDLKKHNRVLLKLFRRKAPKAAVNAGLLHERMAVASEQVNLLPVLDVGEWENNTYAVCEYSEGKSLASFADEETLGLNDIIGIGIKLAKALVAIHEVGVVHRDIRPGNILITPDMEVKLLDIGFLGLSERRASSQKGVKVLPGKYRYTKSDETKDAVHGESADLYSVGVVLFQMATGHSPVRLKSPASSATKTLKERPPTAHMVNPSLPVVFSDILDGLLERNRESRISSADQLLSRLSAIESLEASKSNSPKVESEKELVVEDNLEESGSGSDRRYVNTWFEREMVVQVPPLVVNSSYAFKLNIGSRRTDSTARFKEPDFGGRNEISLLVSLFGDDFEVENRCLPLKLPQKGDSLVVETKVKPLLSKICKLEIVISLAVELEVIQTCEIEVSTIDAIAPVTLSARAAR